MGHLQAAIRKEGEIKGLIPIAVIAAYDSKIVTLSKFLNPKAESDTLLVMSLVLNAAKSIDSVRVSSSKLLMGKKDSYSSEVLESLVKDDCTSLECLSARALLIPDLTEKPIELLTLKLSPGQCYMDEISRKLGVEDSSHVLVSRFMKPLNSLILGRSRLNRDFIFVLFFNVSGKLEELHLRGGFISLIQYVNLFAWIHHQKQMLVLMSP